MSHCNVFRISGIDFLSGGQPLSLVVLLPPEFPKDRPSMFVEPRNVKHPWVRDDGAIVGAPGKHSPFSVFVFFAGPLRAN